MDYSILTMADQLEHHRASALERENELRRSLADRGVVIAPADRGVVIAPARPVVDALHSIGVWFHRPAKPAVRIGIAH